MSSLFILFVYNILLFVSGITAITLILTITMSTLQKIALSSLRMHLDDRDFKRSCFFFKDQ
jgi:hypothetical protein